MRADRLLMIMLRLQAQKTITTQTLADELGVSRRTILRDVEALSAAGIPIFSQSGQGGGIGLDENYRTSLTGLKEGEVRALFLSNNSKLLNDIGLGEAAESTLPKLFAALPSLHQQAIEQMQERIYFDSHWWNSSEAPPLLDTLLQAVYDNRLIRVVYQHHDGEVVERTLQPYSLVAKTSIWYLIARRDDMLRTYRVSRFLSITVLDERFQRLQHFNLRTYWHDHSQRFFESLLQYEFTLKVHERQLNFIRWYDTGRYTIIEPIDASGWFTAKFEAESIEPAKMLVFGLGRDAVVVEPKELLEAVIEQSREFLSSNRIIAQL